MQRIILSLFLLGLPAFAANTVTQILGTMEGLTAGQAPTPTLLANGQFGAAGTWTVQAGAAGSLWCSNFSVGLPFVSATQVGLVNPLKLFNGSQQGIGGKWLVQLNNNGPGSDDGIDFGFNAGAKRASLGFYFYSTVPTNNSTAKDCAIIRSGTGEFVLMKMISAGQYSLEYPESAGPDATITGTYYPNVLYWATLLYDVSSGNAIHQINIYYATNLVLVGSGSVNVAALHTDPAVSCRVGILNGRESATTYFASKDWIMDTNSNAVFPLMPGSCVAQSLSSSDIQTAINFADQGDRVVLPVGSNILTSGLTWNYVNGAITSIGGGYTGALGPSFTVQGYGATWNRTVLSNNIDTTTPTLYARMVGTNFFYISNLWFATYQQNLNGQVAVSCDDVIPTNVFRMTGCGFYVSPVNGASSAYNGFYSAAANGLIDNCYFRSTNVDTGSGHAIFPSDNGNNITKTNWDTPFAYGTTNCLVIESCTFDFEGSDDGAIDNDKSPNVVVRFCTFTNCFFTLHGADSAARAPRSWEFYWNRHYSRANARGAYVPGRTIHIRGGTGVIWANSFDSAWNGMNAVYFRQFRAAATYDSGQGMYTGTAGYLPTGGLQGPMNGSRNVDGNQAASGWPGLDQIGRGSFAVNPVVWTATFTVPNYEQSEPAYLWTNNVNGNLSPVASCTDYANADISATIIVNGRDFNDNTAKPAYTALVYPHPLIGGGVSYWPISAPPVVATPTIVISGPATLNGFRNF